MKPRKRHCGLVVNYACNAACRHCLYACSPKRNSGYMSEDSCERICLLLQERGIDTIHIGGGEPFLDFKSLLGVIRTVRRAGLNIEYLETNGFWASDEKRAVYYLGELKQAGAETLLISIDPFHVEYVPVESPLRLADICKKVEFGYFLWQEQFQEKLSHLESDRVYSRYELEKTLSQDYILETTEAYGLGTQTGRAINIAQEYFPKIPVADLIKNSHACHNLLNTTFMHIDLYEKFIIPGCTGITIPLEDAVRGVPRGRYPVYEALVSDGVAGLLKFIDGLGLTFEEEYVSYCSLCFNIRHWLSKTGTYAELDSEHYEAVLSYY